LFARASQTIILSFVSEEKFKGSKPNTPALFAFFISIWNGSFGFAYTGFALCLHAVFGFCLPKKESGCSVKPFFAGCALPFRGILMYSIAHGKAPILIITPLECYQHSQGQSISISQIIPQSLSIGYLKGASVWYILLLQVKSLFLMKQINFFERRKRSLLVDSSHAR
jgi:hypothetical protein